MKLTRTLMMTVAATILSTAAMAEGNTTNSSNSMNGTVNDQSSTESYSSQNDMNSNTGSNVQTSTSSNVQASANLDSETIENVQASLKDAGHNVSTDGVWGPKTAAALRDFQQANGLTPTGSIDSQTLAALDIDRGM
jgi:peptidoglycan hydrolase-like protein with peptidoglycan-binding domain